MAENSTLRCFIALNFPPEVKAAAQELIHRLSCAPSRIAWVRPESLHLTIKFLGNIPASRLKEIKERLFAAAAGITPFNLQFTNLGVFPNQRQPRIIWWGLKCDTPALMQLVQNMEKSLSSAGFPPETRHYSPHVTLGRIRQLSHPKNLIELINKTNISQMPPILINRVDLMQSILGKDGANYSRLTGVELV